MRVFWALGIFMMASGTCVAAEPAASDYADVFVISVLPRSPSVQPFIMSIPAKEQPKQAASLKPDSFVAKR